MKRTAQLSLVAALLGAACTTVTEVSEVWRDPGWDEGRLAKVLVIGVAKDAGNRRLFEDRFVREIEKRGGEAASSYGLLPDVDRLSEEQVRTAVAAGGFDGVVVTHLVGRGLETTTVQPRPQAMPRVSPGYYRDYTATYEIVRQPSYTVTNEVVRLDTRLYDLRSGEQVWSARSATIDPSSLESGIASVTRAVTKRMAADGMIP